MNKSSYDSLIGKIIKETLCLTGVVLRFRVERINIQEDKITLYGTTTDKRKALCSRQFSDSEVRALINGGYTSYYTIGFLAGTPEKSYTI